MVLVGLSGLTVLGVQGHALPPQKVNIQDKEQGPPISGQAGGDASTNQEWFKGLSREGQPTRQEGTGGARHRATENRKMGEQADRGRGGQVDRQTD